MKDDVQGLTITSFSLLPDGKRFFPVGFAPDSSSLRRFLANRLLSFHRAFALNLTLNCGFNLRNQAELLAFSRGLSLTDDFWIAYSLDEELSEVYFRLQPLNRDLARLALTGHGLPSRASLSPEWTNQGVMPKAWFRKEGQLYLYKGSTVEGTEQYSEYYGSKLASFLGINAVDYDLLKQDEVLYSRCPLFLDEDSYFAPASWLFPSGEICQIRDYCQSQGEEWLNAFADMIILDFLLANGDRHFRNFGFLVDKDTNLVKGFAPLFDFGAGLFSYGFPSNWQRALSSFRLYGVFDSLSFTQSLLNERGRKKLLTLKDFVVPRHPRYNLPVSQLKTLEAVIKHQANRLLQCH